MPDKKEELLRCARELFSQKGFKDTNVADITQMAGMSVGAFYSYYPSKDKLFMEIFLDENRKTMQALMAQINLEDEPAALIKEMLRKNAMAMQANPILRQWYSKDVSGKIERLYREENGLESVDFLYSGFFTIVEKWQAEGKIRADLSCETIMALFSAIIHVGFHKEEIGLKYFPQLQDLLTDFVLMGLSKNPQ